MHSLVMTLLGKDHPGLVESVADVVSRHGGNWLESRMAHLAGQFAGIVHMEVAPEQAEKLIAALEKMQTQGLSVIVHRDSHQQQRGIEERSVWLDLVGGDRPGIVRQVTHLLAELHVNVEEFQTECHSAAMSGDRVFKATARLQLPTGLPANELQQALEQVADDLMVDIDIHMDKDKSRS